MTEDDAMREAVRAEEIRAHGPAADAVAEVEIDETGEQAAAEMESYARAWAEARASEAAYIADRRSLAQAIANLLNDTIPLPEGMRFEWT